MFSFFSCHVTKPPCIQIQFSKCAFVASSFIWSFSFSHFLLVAHVTCVFFHGINVLIYSLIFQSFMLIFRSFWQKEGTILVEKCHFRSSKQQLYNTGIFTLWIMKAYECEWQNQFRAMAQESTLNIIYITMIKTNDILYQLNQFHPWTQSLFSHFSVLRKNINTGINQLFYGQLGPQLTFWSFSRDYISILQQYLVQQYFVCIFLV